jgi:hypothetical protein
MSWRLHTSWLLHHLNCWALVLGDMRGESLRISLSRGFPNMLHSSSFSLFYKSARAVLGSKLGSYAYYANDI